MSENLIECQPTVLDPSYRPPVRKCIAAEDAGSARMLNLVRSRLHPGHNAFSWSDMHRTRAVVVWFAD
jgi:hypothetical protein